MAACKEAGAQLRGRGAKAPRDKRRRGLRCVFCSFFLDHVTVFSLAVRFEPLLGERVLLIVRHHVRSQVIGMRAEGLVAVGSDAMEMVLV